MLASYKAIAERIANAEAHMVETIATLAGLTAAEATTAFDTLRRVKAIKLDAVGGRYIVKHGAFMEVSVLRRAAGRAP